MFPLFELFVSIFHHDDGGVHHGANGDSDTREAHDVRGNTQVIHTDEGHQYSNGQREDDHQGAGEVKKKYQTDHTHRYDQLDNLLFEGGHGSLNEIRTIIGGYDFHAFGEARRNVFLDFFFDPLDHIKDIFTGTDDHNPAGYFTSAVQIRKPSADFRPQLNTGYVL